MATAAIAGEEILAQRSPLALSLHALGCLTAGLVSLALAHPMVARMDLLPADPLMQIAQRLAPRGLVPATAVMTETMQRGVLMILALALLALSLPWLRGAMHSIRHRAPDGNVTAALAVIISTIWTLISVAAPQRLTSAAIAADPLLPSAAIAASILFAAQAIAQRGLRRVRNYPDSLEESSSRQLIAARGRLPVAVSQSVRRGRMTALIAIVAALAAAAVWLAAGSISSLSHAIVAAVAVLFATAPVAFTLSSSLPWITGLQSLWSFGVRARGAEALERLRTARAVFAGTHGAVAESEASVRATAMIGVEQRELLRDAAAVEILADHPIARAIVRRAEALRPDLPGVAGFQAYPGEGVEARLNGRRITVGSPSMLRRLRIDTGPISEEIAGWGERGWTPTVVVADGRVSGAIAVGREPASGGVEAVQRLAAADVEVHLLSGGSAPLCRTFADELKVASGRGELTIEDRASIVAESAARQQTVALGDTDDRMWLEPAQVTVLATDESTAGDDAVHIVVPREGALLGLARSVDVSREAARLGKRNGTHALIHHLIVLPLVSAVAFPLSGWMPPWWAAWIGSPILGACAAGVATVAVVVKGRVSVSGTHE